LMCLFPYISANVLKTHPKSSTLLTGDGNPATLYLKKIGDDNDSWKKISADLSSHSVYNRPPFLSLR